MAKKIENGKNKFFDYFSAIYLDRWESLYAAMKQEDIKVARSVMGESIVINAKEFPAHCYWIDNNLEELREKTASEFKAFYIMDPASIIAARTLEINDSDDVLDMCAAPGGKSLILAEQINGGSLTVNDPSRNRRDRLKRVLDEYLPPHKKQQIKMLGRDGISIGINHPESFDKILVDAPCSGERHIIFNDSELANWSPKRSKRLSSQQYGLMCSALLALKPGGSIVYSTCSISPLENDDVIEKLMDKKGDQFEMDLPNLDVDGIEKTKYGYIFLPDHAGFGPIYFTRLKKSK